MTSRTEILTGLREPETLTIEVALRQAYSIGCEEGTRGWNDSTQPMLDSLVAKVKNGLPVLDPVEAVARVDSRSEGWTPLGLSGLEFRDGGSDSHETVIEYRMAMPKAPARN